MQENPKSLTNKSSKSSKGKGSGKGRGRGKKPGIPFNTGRLSAQEIAEYEKNNIHLKCTLTQWGDVKRSLRDVLNQDSEFFVELDKNRVILSVHNDNGRFYFVAYQDGTYDMTTLRIGKQKARTTYSKTLDGQRGEYKLNFEPGSAYGRPLKPTEKPLNIKL